MNKEDIHGEIAIKFQLKNGPNVVPIYSKFLLIQFDYKGNSSVFCCFLRKGSMLHPGVFPSRSSVLLLLSFSRDRTEAFVGLVSNIIVADVQRSQHSPGIR
jgi:hypothetical protein